MTNCWVPRLASVKEMVSAVGNEKNAKERITVCDLRFPIRPAGARAYGLVIIRGVRGAGGGKRMSLREQVQG